MIPVKQPIYSISNLSYRYPNSSNYVFKNINLAIPKNEISTILGRNGSGKSTLLRILLGYVLPEVGEVHLNFGQQITKYPNDQKGKIAFVLQTEYIGFDYTVMEYILFGQVPFIGFFTSPTKIDQEYTMQVIDELDLSALKYNKITHLSGGVAKSTISESASSESNCDVAG